MTEQPAERRLKTLEEIFDEGVTVQINDEEPFVVRSLQGRDEVDDEPVGSCMWGTGAYGRPGSVHIAINPDGEREECCTFG